MKKIKTHFALVGESKDLDFELTDSIESKLAHSPRFSQLILKVYSPCYDKGLQTYITTLYVMRLLRLNSIL